MAFKFGSGASDVIDPGAVDQVGSGAYSMAAIVVVNSAGTAARSLYSSQGDAGVGGDFYFEFRTDATNNLAFGHRRTDATFPRATWLTGWTAGSIHQVTGVYTGSVLNLYADGSPDVRATATPGSTLLALSGTIVTRIGNHAFTTTRSWDGQIAEFAIWQRALTIWEIVQLGKFYRPPDVADRGLTSYYSCRDLAARNGITLTKPTVTGATLARHPVTYPMRSSFPWGRKLTSDAQEWRGQTADMRRRPVINTMYGAMQ